MIGQRIKELRNQANMTQQELAEGIISRTYLSLIEKNTVHPSTNVLKKLSVRLNCTLDDFTSSTADNNLSLLEIKKEIKWAENHVLMNEFSKMQDFIEKNYETLESITEHERGSVYWVRASYYLNQKDYEKAKEEVNKSINIVKKMKDVTVYLRCLELQAVIEFETDNIMEAINKLTKANNITIFESVVNMSRVSILSKLAEYYRIIGENYVAIKFSEEAMNLNKKLNTYHHAMKLEQTLAKSYDAVDQNEEAEDHYRRAIKYAELQGPGFDVVGNMSNLAMFIIKQNRVDEAYELISKCNQMIEEYHYDHPFETYIRLHLGEVLLKKGQLQEAREIIMEQLDNDNTGYANELLGDIAVEEGNFKGALTYYLESIKGDDLKYYITIVHPKIASAYLELGDKDKAIEYYKKSVSLFKDLTTNVL